MSQNEHLTLESPGQLFSADGEGLGLDDDGLSTLRADILRWRMTTLADAEKKVAPRREQFTTWSGMPVPDLVTPAELSQFARQAGLQVDGLKGLTYNPLTKIYALNADTDVNYMVACSRPL